MDTEEIKKKIHRNTIIKELEKRLIEVFHRNVSQVSDEHLEIIYQNLKDLDKIKPS